MSQVYEHGERWQRRTASKIAKAANTAFAGGNGYGSDRYGREHAYVRVKRAKSEKEGQKQLDSHYQRWAFNELQVHYFKPVQ